MTGGGPGKDFRKGMSIVEVTALFPDDGTAEVWFVQHRWPDGPYCPHCGSLSVLERKSRRPQPYRCRDCRRYFSARTGTPLQGSPLGFRTWVIAIYLLTTNLKGVSSMKLHRDLGVTQKTAWYLAHRIRESWEDEGDFRGEVEVDETYVGGKKKKGVKGRGAVGKAVVVGVKERGTNRVNATVVKGIDKRTLHGFIKGRVVPGSTVYTDELKSYNGIPYPHQTVCHSAGEYVRDMAHTNGIESFWSMLKRAYKGTYHKLSHEHLDRYVREFAGRHNVRSMDTLDQMAMMVAVMNGRRIRYRELIGKETKGGEETTVR